MIKNSIKLLTLIIFTSFGFMSSASPVDKMLYYIDTTKNFPEGSIQMAATCFHKGEQTSGMNKICYYDCLGSTYAITIKSFKLCPLTINN
jgi:hypothetical protein